MIGWKVGFGSPEALKRLRIDRPLVAPLPASGRLPDGATVSLSGWTAPRLEAEIGVWIDQGFSAAIELADVEFPPDDVEKILATGIFHRHVILGSRVRQNLAGITARVTRNGELVASCDDLTALTGPIDWVIDSVRRVAERDLRRGEVVIAGSVVPPLPVAAGERWGVDFAGLGCLTVQFSA